MHATQMNTADDLNNLICKSCRIDIKVTKHDLHHVDKVPLRSLYIARPSYDHSKP